jgi:hypothetical protein
METVNLCENVREDPWSFFEAKMYPQAKAFGKHWNNSANLENSGSFKEFKRISIISLRHLLLDSVHSTKHFLVLGRNTEASIIKIEIIFNIVVTSYVTT